MSCVLASIYICNRVYCIHVSGHDSLNFLSCPLSFFDWVGVLWPQLSKVLKLVRWARRVQGSRRDQKIKRSERREVELDPQVCPQEIMSREVELG